MNDDQPERATPPSWPAEWPPAVRRIATLTHTALDAAARREAASFTGTVAQFERSDAPQASAVHAEMVNMLLEENYPDGLTGENVQEVLQRTVRSADWSVGEDGLPELDVPGFVDVLTGALGVAEAQEQIRARPRPAHALLVVADLLAVKKVRAEVYLRRAIAEIRRAQTVEMP